MNSHCFTTFCLASVLVFLQSQQLAATVEVEADTIRVHSDNYTVSFALWTVKNLPLPYTKMRQRMMLECGNGSLSVYLESKYNSEVRKWEHSTKIQHLNVLKQSQAVQDIATDLCRKL